MHNYIPIFGNLISDSYEQQKLSSDTFDLECCILLYFFRLLVKFPELNYQLKIKVCIDK